ncbi:MAG: hypothetical protein M3R36_15915 [Bacteroidota bacterium]|nr:hypothetical protein [Bacteroidota bacterium]
MLTLKNTFIENPIKLDVLEMNSSYEYEGQFPYRLIYTAPLLCYRVSALPARTTYQAGEHCV